MAQGGSTRTQFQEKLKLSLAKDDRDCRLLVKGYNDVIAQANKSPLVKDLVLQLEPNFFKHAEHGITDLNEVDRPIIVIGESSSGKSSFLNLLIGRKVLPDLAAPCTHCMCCIKKGEELEAHVSSFDGSKSNKSQIISANGKSDEDFQTALEKLVNQDNCKKALDRCIDIFVPSSILEDNVYLVDTPGFGETKQVTESLIKYLPKAIGIIFILNPTVNLGMSEDRGALILDEIKRLRKEGKIPSFDPTKIVFIGNKWDQIKEKERKDHRLKMIKKLEKVWPNFQEDQLLHLSVNYILRLQESTNSIPEDYKSVVKDYQAVLDRIRETVEHCGNARSQVHKRFLSRVFEHLKTFVTLTILSVQEKQAELKSLKVLINGIESKHEEERARMNAMATEIQRKVAEDFHQYLNNKEYWKDIFQWENSTIPKGTEYNVVKQKAYATIRASITAALTKHLAMSEPVLLDLKKTLTIFALGIQMMRAQIDNFLIGTDNEVLCPGEGNNEEQTENELSGGDIVLLVISAPIWIPLGLVAVVGVLPFAAYAGINNHMKLSEYTKEHGKYLDRWSEKIIRKEFSKEALEEMIFRSLTKYITEAMDDIERSIETFKSLILHVEENMNEDVRPGELNELKDLCHRLNGILNATE